MTHMTAGKWQKNQKFGNEMLQIVVLSQIVLLGNIKKVRLHTRIKKQIIVADMLQKLRLFVVQFRNGNV